MNRAPMKRTAFKRAPRTTAKTESNRALALDERAQRAIKNAQSFEISKSSRKPYPDDTGKARLATKYVASASTAPRTIPKTTAHRNPHLLSMAKGKPCLLCQEHGVALCTPGSTVAAHSNQQCHGKGMGRKADDCYTAWLGDQHHRWLDQGKGSAAQREMAFMTAHLAQVNAWRAIAYDSRSTPRDRSAALWALGLLNSQPFPTAALEGKALAATKSGAL